MTNEESVFNKKNRITKGSGILLEKKDNFGHIMRFDQLIDIINETHITLQQKAASAVNQGLTVRNWLIGFYIFEFEQNGEDRAKYGERLLEKIAESTINIRGLSLRNLKLCRQFYTKYQQIGQTVSAQLQMSNFEKLRTVFTKSAFSGRHRRCFSFGHLLFGHLNFEFRVSDLFFKRFPASSLPLFLFFLLFFFFLPSCFSDSNMLFITLKMWNFLMKLNTGIHVRQMKRVFAHVLYGK